MNIIELEKNIRTNTSHYIPVKRCKYTSYSQEDIDSINEIHIYYARLMDSCISMEQVYNLMESLNKRMRRFYDLKKDIHDEWITVMAGLSFSKVRMATEAKINSLKYR